MFGVMKLPLLLLLASVAASRSAPPRRSHVCVSKFESTLNWETSRWDAITDLGQAINALVVTATGTVAPLTPSTWPMQYMIDAAHGNATRITATIHPESKPAAATFLDLPAATIQATAHSAVSIALKAGYDGVQLDWEGLQTPSAKGLLIFLSACKEALAAKPHTTLSITVYAPKLVFNDFGPYNLLAFQAVADYIFIMGYDMAPTGVPVGSGWKQAGPQAPLDALGVALDHAVAAGAPAASLILALPFYGKVSICNGTQTPLWGNCSCGVKLRLDKSIDLLSGVAVNRTLGCFEGYDATSATPFVDCPHGTGLPGVPVISTTTRQQAWFENARSLSAKVQLAATRGVAGVGVWSADGVASTTPEGKQIWDIFAQYVRGL